VEDPVHVCSPNDSGREIPEDRAYRLPLPPHPIAAEQARILVRLALAEWSLSSVLDNALIIAAELAANAVKIGEAFHRRSPAGRARAD
jgi:hypothetical protein